MKNYIKSIMVMVLLLLSMVSNAISIDFKDKNAKSFKPDINGNFYVEFENSIGYYGMDGRELGEYKFPTGKKLNKFFIANGVVPIMIYDNSNMLYVHDVYLRMKDSINLKTINAKSNQVLEMTDYLWIYQNSNIVKYDFKMNIIQKISYKIDESQLSKTIFKEKMGQFYVYQPEKFIQQIDGNGNKLSFIPARNVEWFTTQMDLESRKEIITVGLYNTIVKCPINEMMNPQIIKNINGEVLGSILINDIVVKLYKKGIASETI